jgi:hypothetical protein
MSGVDGWALRLARIAADQVVLTSDHNRRRVFCSRGARLGCDQWLLSMGARSDRRLAEATPVEQYQGNLGQSEHRPNGRAKPHQNMSAKGSRDNASTAPLRWPLHSNHPAAHSEMHTVRNAARSQTVVWIP